MYITDEDLIYHKEDRFIKSIPELVKTNSVNTLEEFKYLLDNNGYYGRNKVFKYINYKKSNNACIAKIYLPDSIKEYFWPVEGGYCLYNKKYVNYPRGKFHTFYQFGMNHIKEVERRHEYNIYKIQKEFYSHGAKGKKMITDFLKYNIVQNGKMTIAQTDVKEVYYNLFDSTWIY